MLWCLYKHDNLLYLTFTIQNVTLMGLPKVGGTISSSALYIYIYNVCIITINYLPLTNGIILLYEWDSFSSSTNYPTKGHGGLEPTPAGRWVPSGYTSFLLQTEEQQTNSTLESIQDLVAVRWQQELTTAPPRHPKYESFAWNLSQLVEALFQRDRKITAYSF